VDNDESVYRKLCAAGSPLPRSYVLNAKREVVYQGWLNFLFRSSLASIILGFDRLLCITIGVGYNADDFKSDFLECCKQELAV
jgi:hypothetical protein